MNVFFEKFIEIRTTSLLSSHVERMHSSSAIISRLIVKRTHSAVFFSIESSLLIASKTLDIVKKSSTTRIDEIEKNFGKSNVAQI
ncbi:hypothetical protein C2G38_2235003 [Gigaspora rosea]|uniref:Uncharacterized protein n=1 Tax=Gigaspora rosea TaxID=44941 RepID=A0A397TZJ7_9GLOM|nr:hypothetical protein C2G38_2235003 [Gigaspora rosea]